MKSPFEKILANSPSSEDLIPDYKIYRLTLGVWFSTLCAYNGELGQVDPTFAPTNVSDLLGPGVYVLRLRGKVVYCGRAEVSMLVWIYAHAMNKKSEYFPPQAKPVRFDQIEVYPCAKGEVEDTWDRVYAKLYGPTVVESTIRRRYA